MVQSAAGGARHLPPCTADVLEVGQVLVGRRYVIISDGFEAQRSVVVRWRAEIVRTLSTFNHLQGDPSARGLQ